jgi:hypothetical protein
MGQIAEQVHAKFKVFTGALEKDGTLGKLASDVESWVAAERVAPKSIGVEFLESAGVLILSVGYRDDEPPYRVKLTSTAIGSVESVDPGSLESIEKAMANASSTLKNVICHELYVTADNTLLMVFMAHQPQ